MQTLSFGPDGDQTIHVAVQTADDRLGINPELDDYYSSAGNNARTRLCLYLIAFLGLRISHEKICRCRHPRAGFFVPRLSQRRGTQFRLPSLAQLPIRSWDLRLRGYRPLFGVP